MNKIPEWKKKEVERLTDLLTNSPVVGVVDIEGIPAYQMQQMRSKLRETMNIIVSRNTLIEKSLKNAEKEREGIENLNDHLQGQTALVTTYLNPFKLFRRMEATKTKAPARGGETAPEDIKVEKGETPFKPGPIVGDLQKAGIPASIQGGKVVINKNKTVVKEGEKISQELATMLRRLGIQPITVGLDLRVVFEEGTLFDKEILDVDVSEYVKMIKNGALSAFNLSLNAGYPTLQNVKTMFMKASRDAFSLAINSNLITNKTIKIKLSQAQREMLSLAAKMDTDSLDDELLKQLGIEVERKEKEGMKEKSSDIEESEDDNDED